MVYDNGALMVGNIDTIIEEIKKELDIYLENGINYTNLMHLNILLNLINVINDNDLFMNKINFKRILYRNSIIKVRV